MQGICDENLNFMDVFIGYPGSVHDARVFRNSSVYRNLNFLCGNGKYTSFYICYNFLCYLQLHFESLFSEYILLGDSAYPLLPQLITPYRDNGHLNRNQKNFNKRLSSVRVSIEHAFGLLKQRFRQLYYLKLRGHQRQCMFIHACCVLHNMANKDDEAVFQLELENTDDLQPLQDDNPDDENTGAEIRNQLCREMFD